MTGFGRGTCLVKCIELGRNMVVRTKAKRGGQDERVE